MLEEDVFGAGLTEYDFLDGDEPYKASFATGERPLFDIELFRPTRWGRLAALAGGIGGMARRTVKARLRPQSP